MNTEAKQRGGQSSHRSCKERAMPRDHGRIATICAQENTPNDPGELMVERTEVRF
jgi:hypothetical protein